MRRFDKKMQALQWPAHFFCYVTVKLPKTGQELENAFHFLAETFGEGQEMVIFLSELSASVDAMKFIQEYGSREYDRQSRLLLLKDRRQALREEIFSLTEEKE